MTPLAKATDAKDEAPPLDDRAAEAEIDRLSKLADIPYARQRLATAKRIGITPPSLDKLVRKTRGVEPAATMQGQPIQIDEAERWPEAVDGAALLNATADTLRQYVILTDEQIDAVALWILHTHAHDACDTSPKLVVKSPQKRSGKTRLVETLTRITARPLSTSGIRPAALLRLIEMHQPTLLLDEMDAAMKGDRELFETMRGLINSGFDRAGARYIINVPLPDGGFEPRAFSTWCPQVLSGIGDLPETVRDRAIEIDMQRKRGDQKVSRLRRRDGGELQEIARKSARWAADKLEALRKARPDMPLGLNDRAADAWEPLVAIADLVGDGWPKRARNAALKLSGDGVVDEDNAGSKLLADIREVFEFRKGVDRLASSELAEALGNMSDRPWADWRNGRPITQNALANLLKHYRDAIGIPIIPNTLRIGDRTPKGYLRTQFEDAFTRYLSPSPHSNRNTATTAAAEAVPANTEPQRSATVLPSEISGKPNKNGHCGGVALHSHSEVTKPKSDGLREDTEGPTAQPFWINGHTAEDEDIERGAIQWEGSGGS